MKISRPLAFTLLLGCLPVLGACSSGDSASGGIAASINNTISKAMAKAQEKLRTQPITVSHGDPDLPDAKITPKGDFIVDGKAIAITPAQRDAVLEYRQQLIAVVSQGIAIGKQGAALGLHAAGTAIAAALSGKSEDEIRAKVEARTAGIKQAAAKICDRLPALRKGQQQLAAALPAFKPYATMTQEDVDDCRTDALSDDSSNG